MLRAHRHDGEDAVDELRRHPAVEQIAHRVDEDHPAAPPPQRDAEVGLDAAHLSVEVDLAAAVLHRQPDVMLLGAGAAHLRHVLEPVAHVRCVAVVAPRADAGAADRHLPCRVAPLNSASIAHAASSSRGPRGIACTLVPQPDDASARNRGGGHIRAVAPRHSGRNLRTARRSLSAGGRLSPRHLPHAAQPRATDLYIPAAGHDWTPHTLRERRPHETGQPETPQQGATLCRMCTISCPQSDAVRTPRPKGRDASPPS